MLTDDILAYPDRRMRRVPSEAERRRLLARDAFAWTMVVLIHLAIFLGLVISLEQARRYQGRRGPVERFLDLSLLRRNTNLPLNIVPPEPDIDQRDISAKPLTVIRPKEPVIEVAPPRSSPPAGDVLNSIGQFLACGASIFEYLTPQQQARCLLQPWHGLLMPDGSIILAGPPRLASPGPLQMTGAEAQRRQSQTAPDCPPMLNTPCLAGMFNGGGLAPGMPEPH